MLWDFTQEKGALWCDGWTKLVKIGLLLVVWLTMAGLADCFFLLILYDTSCMHSCSSTLFVSSVFSSSCRCFLEYNTPKSTDWVCRVYEGLGERRIKEFQYILDCSGPIQTLDSDSHPTPSSLVVSSSQYTLAKSCEFPTVSLIGPPDCLTDRWPTDYCPRHVSFDRAPIRPLNARWNARLNWILDY